MNVVGALVRKEWHEHKTEAAVLSVVLGTFTLATTLTSARDIVADFLVASGLFSLFVAVFMSVAAVTRERVERVQEFVLCLPVSRRRVGLIRMLMTLATCTVPIASTAVLVHIAIVSGVATGNVNDLWVVALIASGCATSLTLWIAAIAIDQPNQARAGLVALFVLALWFAISLLLTGSPDRPGWPLWLIDLVLNVGPGGWWRISTVPVGRPNAGMVLTQLLANTTLLFMAAMNYGRVTAPPRQVRRVRTPDRSSRMDRYRSPWLALCWLHIHEIAPMVYAGLFFAVVSWVCQSILFRPESTSPTVLTRSMTIASVAFGLFWMGLVAVVMFVPSLQPRLETFWRSRPLSASRWFWSRVLIVLVVSVVCLNLPALLSVGIRNARSEVAPGSELTGQICVVMTHTMAFSVALFAACLLRQSVYAGILSLSASAMVLLLPLTAGQPQWNATLSLAHVSELLRVDVAAHRLVQFVESGFVVTSANDLAFLPFLVLTASASVAGMCAAWLVVRRNIVLGDGGSQ